MKLTQAQSNLVLEYARLAARSELSELEADRMGEILELAESDDVLGIMINEVDYFVLQELNLLDDDSVHHYENQKARIKEFIEPRLGAEQDEYSSVEEEIIQVATQQHDYCENTNSGLRNLTEPSVEAEIKSSAETPKAVVDTPELKVKKQEAHSKLIGAVLGVLALVGVGGFSYSSNLGGLRSLVSNRGLNGGSIDVRIPNILSTDTISKGESVDLNNGTIISGNNNAPANNDAIDTTGGELYSSTTTNGAGSINLTSSQVTIDDLLASGVTNSRDIGIKAATQDGNGDAAAADISTIDTLTGGNIAIQDGQLIVQGEAIVQDIQLGGTGDNANVLDVTGTELSNLNSNFSSITIGRTHDSGTITIAGDLSFSQTVTLRSPLGSGSINHTSGTLKVTDSAPVTLPANQDITIGDMDSSFASNGGNITFLRDAMIPIDSSINVFGTNGGGNVWIGGDDQGEGTVPNAQRTFVSSDSVIHANALANSDGGQVIVWSDETTGFDGNEGSISNTDGLGSGDITLVTNQDINTNDISSASDMELQGQAGSATATLAGNADDLIVAAGPVTLRGGSIIEAQSYAHAGSGIILSSASGNINLTANASESVGVIELTGAGDAGKLTENTERLIIRGRAGITASDKIELTGTSGDNQVNIASRAIDGGNITLIGRSIASDGGNITFTSSQRGVDASTRGVGDADTLKITATDSVNDMLDHMFRRHRIPASDFTVSSEFGIDDTVEIKQFNADSSQRLYQTLFATDDYEAGPQQGIKAGGSR